MANAVVQLPVEYFPDTNKGRPLWDAKIYIGTIDLDPRIPANQKVVTGRQENGTEVALAQPVRTNSGGVPVDASGNIVTLLVDGAYSMAVDDRQDNQKYYFANVLSGSPLTFEQVSTSDILNAALVTATGTTTPRSLADRSGENKSIIDDGGIDKIYVSTIGSDTNSGLTVGSPVLTLDRAAELFEKYQFKTNSTITIKIAAGTYNEGLAISNVKNRHELVVEGELLAGVPSVIIDGTSATKPMGLNFNSMNNVRVKYIKVQNFGGVGSGIIIQNGTRGVIDTCDSESNAEAGFNCSEDSEMVVIGTCNIIGNDITKFGLRYYRNSGGSVSDNTNPITITGCTSAGLVSRDGSKVVTVNNFNVSNCNLTNTSTGVLAQKDGYIELRTCTITGNSIGAYAENNSIIDTQTGVRNVSGNVRDIVIRDNSSDRSLFTYSALPMQTWVPNSKPSGLIGNSGYDLVVDYDGTTGMQWLVNGNNVNLNFDKKSVISYIGSDYSFRFTVNGTDAIRLIDAPTSNKTSMLLLVNDGAATSLRQVKVGAADSGGSGQRLLTVDN